MGRRDGPETVTEPGFDEECLDHTGMVGLALSYYLAWYRRERRGFTYGWFVGGHVLKRKDDARRYWT